VCNGSNIRDILDDSLISGNVFIYEPVCEVKPAAAHSRFLAHRTLTQNMTNIIYEQLPIIDEIEPSEHLFDLSTFDLDSGMFSQ
jgi:hypothetical protein